MKKPAMLLLLLLMAVGPALASPEVREGEWEFVITTDIPGLPYAMPPVRNIVCLQGDDAVPQKSGPGQNCTMIEQKIKGNAVSWVMECKDANGTVRSQGEIVYQGNSFAGTMLTRTKGGGGEMEMNQKLSGRRLGPCR